MIETQQRPDACPTILLHPADNVLIARTLIELGAKLDGGLSSRGQVPSGHKIASRPIAKGDPIRKYNVTIGFASAQISRLRMQGKSRRCKKNLLRSLVP